MPGIPRCPARQALCLILLTAISFAALANMPQVLVSASSATPAASSRLTSQPTTNQSANEVDAATRAKLSQAYGRLPLSFEANQGQTGAEVKYLSRGPGYSLFLTSTEAVLALRGDAKPQSENRIPPSATLRMSLIGAHAAPRVMGLDELPGRSNYFNGNDPKQWRSDVASYRKVRYENVYEGVNLVYYGTQRQLEYDFVVAAGADPQVIRLSFKGAEKIEIDDAGDLVLHTSAGEVRQHRPVTYQEIDGVRQEIASSYALEGEQVGFRVGEYDRSRPLIIDPVLVYSTYLGGSDFDQATAVAVDTNGYAYVAGFTLSTNFPVAGAIPQGTRNGSDYDAFVAKLNPAGTALVYSTYLGGSASDGANSIAVTSIGLAYVTGWTSSNDFPTVNPLQAANGGGGDAFITKLNPVGSALLYSTYLGGGSYDEGKGIALDEGGNAYVTGQASSRDFPTATPYQSTKKGNPAFKSTDGGANWNVSDNGLSPSNVTALGFDPANASTIYAGTENGVFKSTDNGTGWNAANTGLDNKQVNSLAINPASPSTILAGTPDGLYRSTSGGSAWSRIEFEGTSQQVTALAFDPVNTSQAYALISGSLQKSTDGGATWNNNELPAGAYAYSFAIDPANTSTLYIGSTYYIYKSTDGGDIWTSSGSFNYLVTALAINPANTALIYAGTDLTGVYKSTNGGNTWTPTSLGSGFKVTALRIDPATPSTVYAATNKGLYKSINSGSTWSVSNTGLTSTALNALALDPANPSTIYTGADSGSEAFVAKLNPPGAILAYSTYLGGQAADYATGIALGPGGDAYVTGYTNSTNFPTANALQANFGGGLNDGFVTRLSNTGSTLLFSTYLGGTLEDKSLGIAVDANGNAVVTGSTESTNFPKANALQATRNGPYADAFISKLNAGGSAFIYSTYLGGSNEDAGRGIALDTFGNAYVIGNTSSFDFPVAGASQAENHGNGDAFVTKVDPAGSSLVYSTYLGDYEVDRGNGIAVDAGGNAYAVGDTLSSFFPTVNPLQASNGGIFDAFVTKLGSASDLIVTMTDAPDPVTLGNDLTYTINVTNSGGLAATGVNLTDTLPAGASLVSATASNGTCGGATTVNCNLGDIAIGAGATVTVVVKPPAVKNITNTASVTSNEPDSNPVNNTATQSTDVNFADLSVTATTVLDTVAPGSKINYLISIRNNGSAASSAVKVMDTLPVETTFVSCVAVGGVCGGTGNDRTVTFSTLPPGESRSIILVATMSNAVADGLVINNTATVSASVPDPEQGNNSASTTVTVSSTPLKLKNNGKIIYGSDVSGEGLYTINANGTGEAQFPLPPGQAGGAPAWSPDGKKLAFQRPSSADYYPLQSVYVVNANGTGLVEVGKSLEDNHRIAWSPNGKTLAVTGVDSVIQLANVDGAGQSKHPKSPTGINDLAWSPDGTKLAYTKSSDIWVMNIDGSAPTNLTHNTSVERNPRWSPDGTRLLFTRDRGSVGYQETYVMNSDGTGVSRLFNNVDSSEPAWSPDGKKVVFISLNELHVMNFDGTGQAQLSNNGAYHWAPDWQPIPTNTPLPPPPPPVNLYSISGHVTNSFGDSLSSEEITLSGTRTGTVISDENGNFSFVRLPEGGNYTVTAVERPDISYNPPSYTFSNLTANKTANFAAAAPAAINITGHIKDATGAPVPNVEVRSQGGWPEGTTRTDANGYYIFPDVSGGRTYTITPNQFGAYSFAPQLKTLPYLGQSATADFVATKHPTKTIGGRVTSATAPNAGVQGVFVHMSRNGFDAGFVITDANGNYSFGDQQTGYNYSLGIYDSDNYTYAPNSVEITNLRSDQMANFVQHRLTGYYIIAGKVLDEQNRPLGGVVVKISGYRNDQAITEPDGSYSFLNLQGGFSYTLTPSKRGYSFLPGSRTYASLRANQNGANFKASVATAYNIGGQVKAGTTGVAGVTMTVTSASPAGFAPRTVTTNATGSYTFTNLPLGRNYVVKPSHVNYSFAPASRAYPNLGANQTDASFAATLKTYNVSGKIVKTGTTTALGGVTVTITSPTPGGFAARTATTNAAGVYNFTGLPAGRNYTLKPSKTGFTFSPATKTVTNLSGSLAQGTATNFTGTQTSAANTALDSDLAVRLDTVDLNLWLEAINIGPLNGMVYSFSNIN